MYNPLNTWLFVWLYLQSNLIVLPDKGYVNVSLCRIDKRRSFLPRLRNVAIADGQKYYVLGDKELYTL